MSEAIYTGKARQLLKTDDPKVIQVHFSNQVTALNGREKSQIPDKGEVNNKISSLAFKHLNEQGIRTDFIKQISDNDQLNQKLDMIPLEVVTRNLASGSFQRRFKTEPLEVFEKPVQEFYYKSDALDDPFINDDEVEHFKIVSSEQIHEIKQFALKVNDILKAFFNEVNITLVDFKLEFGYDEDGNIVLGDEVSPDSCRLIDKETKKSLDKDVFRKQLGNMMTGYHEVLDRLQKAYE